MKKINNKNSLITCVECKFWNPENDDTGVCLRGTVVYQGVLDADSLVIAECYLSVPRYHYPDQETDPIGTFIDGSPFEDLLARRIENNLEKAVDRTCYMITSRNFACNQAEKLEEPCSEVCVHCYGLEEE